LIFLSCCYIAPAKAAMSWWRMPASTKTMKDTASRQQLRERADWPFESAVRSGAPFEVLIGDRLDAIPVGPYPELPQRAFILPITPPGYSGPAAFAVAGVSPRLTLNEAYLTYYELLAVALTAFVAYTDDREAEEARG
jgi:hypothetical protein